MKKLKRYNVFFLLCIFSNLFICCSDISNGSTANNIPLTFEVGDVVTINGEPEGIVFHVDEDKTSGKILCRERHKSKFCGLYTKACSQDYGFQLVTKSSKTNGQDNWDLWCQLLPDFEGSSYYDAGYWCKYVKGLEWYIPALEEIKEINLNLSKINDTTDWLSEQGYFTNLFDSTRTWSSTPRSLNTDYEPNRLAIWVGNGTASNLCNDDTYCVQPVRVFDKNTSGLGKMSRTQSNGDPTIFRLDIPFVSNTRKGKTVIIDVVGNNFSDTNLTISDFSAKCPSKPSIVSNSKLAIYSNTLIRTELTIPEEIGEYEITISFGPTSKKGILKVKDFSSYSIGDILLSDDTIISCDPSNVNLSEEQKQNVIGIMSGYNSYGTPLFLGIYNSAGGKKSGYYNWAPQDTNGCKTIFSGNICTPSKTGIGAVNTATFSDEDDINGSDNWAYICRFYYSDTNNAEYYYPAFNYVKNYASTFNLSGKYEKGWYMPSIAELCDIIKNKTEINKILEAIGGVQLDNCHYWSSSQCADSGNSEWAARGSDGDIRTLGKTLSSNSTYSLRVCCVRALD